MSSIICGKCMAYDNITKKQIYPYTRSNIPIDCIKEINYGYENGRLKNYNGETFVYDNIGNPTTYRGKAATWTKGRQLRSYNGVTFEYDGKGKRTKKGNITFEYDAAGNIISQSNGLEFLLDATGVIGVKYGGNHYFYRKDIQKNVIALLDSNGNVVVQYVYDAWGNHAVLDANGNDITSATHIGNLNPYRYRGYYYDTETGLYYLQTRYYDPELCRFMTIDEIEYIEEEPTCGRNLYAYCANNPVMYFDPTGESFLALFLILAAGVISGGAIGGVVASKDGKTGWDLVKDIFLGAAIGLAVSGAILAVTGAAVGAFAGASYIILGVKASQMFAIGAIAFNFTAFFVAPLYGIEMESIDYETPESPYQPPKPNLLPVHPGSKNNYGRRHGSSKVILNYIFGV